jgi:electron transport complex protein RnfB
MKPGSPGEIALFDAVALIDEARCIGCTLCIQACPVDAIAGAAKMMHTVIASACTGCELCVPPCPVDCIALRPVERPQGALRLAATTEAQRRCEARNLRLAREQQEKAANLAVERAASAERRKRETIAKALARARERLQSRGP